jgi:protein phosphatase
VRSEGKSRFGLTGLGSTVVLALIRDNSALVAHMGDSRAYLSREQRLEQLTRDHTLAQLLVDCGEITSDQIATHPAQTQLTRFVGMQTQPMPETRLLELLLGDRLLLCSDGLTSMLDHDSISLILRRHQSPDVACQELIDAANEAGGKDNITVVIVANADDT